MYKVAGIQPLLVHVDYQVHEIKDLCHKAHKIN